jgi:hypothetical protein
MPNSLVAQANLGAYLAPIIKWTGITIASILLIVLFIAIYYRMLFTVKIKYWTLYGTTDENVYTIGKMLLNRARWVNNKTEWRLLWPLGNKKPVQPFDQKYINSNKIAYAVETNDTYMPVQFGLDITKDGVIGKIDPVPYAIRSWQSLTHKKHNQEFAQHNFWEDNKTLFMTIGAIALCCLLCAVTIYFTYQFVAPKQEAMNALAQALMNRNVVPGI